MILEKNEKLPLPGNWYLLASCEYCHAQHVVETDPSQGTSLPREYYQSECPGCLRIGLYAAGQIEHYQHAGTLHDTNRKAL